MMMALKNIIANLNKENKWDVNNYDKWYQFMIYVLDEQ